MAELRRRIKHVIYIVKENRTYDQVLGDLGRGNGDPILTLFGDAVTPNQHALAREFVDLDNFYDAGEVSGEGWPWSTEAREMDVGVKAMAMQYAGRGQSYDVEGINRNVNVAIPTLAGRRAANPATPDDPDLLPGTGDVAAPDAPGEEGPRPSLGCGAARASDRAQLRLLSRYGALCADEPRSAAGRARSLRSEDASRLVGRSGAADAAPIPISAASIWRCRTFGASRNGSANSRSRSRTKTCPHLSLVRFMTDHTGEFKNAIDGVNTPERQVADNDYAVGKLIDKVANSPYRDSTLIFVIEDDAQDGPDHVDAHRSTAFVVGPYVKHGAVVSARYTTVNMLRTIEDILGIEPLNINDAYQRPMTEVFDLNQELELCRRAIGGAARHRIAAAATRRRSRPARFADAHDAAYWADADAGYDWSKEDAHPGRRLQSRAVERIGEWPLSGGTQRQGFEQRRLAGCRKLRRSRGRNRPLDCLNATAGPPADG